MVDVAPPSVLLGSMYAVESSPLSVLMTAVLDVVALVEEEVVEEVDLDVEVVVGVVEVEEVEDEVSVGVAWMEEVEVLVVVGVVGFGVETEEEVVVVVRVF